MASYLARSRSTNEPEASRTKAALLKHFLREVEAFQLDHGLEKVNEMEDKTKAKELDDKIKGFRTGLEHMMGHAPTSVAVQPGQPGQPGAPNTNTSEKGFGIDNSNTG